MKQLVKKVVQSAVAAAAPAAWRVRRPSLLVLMYHRVLPQDHPDRAREQPGMYVSPESLDLHLEVLSRYATFIHLDEWLERVQAGRAVPPRACAVTFDDGWRDNYEHAFPILRRRGVPATIYLVSDLVGTQYSFWPNALLNFLSRPAGDADPSLAWPHWLSRALEELEPRAIPNRTVDAELIDRVIEYFKARHTDAEMIALTRELDRSPADRGRDLMSWDEAREMASSGVIRFGSHTRRHTRLLGSLEPKQMEDEILGSRHIIEEHLGSRPRTFCYPNGDYNEGAVNLVRTAYLGAVTTRPGWNSPSSNVYELTRVGVHEDVSRTREAFLSRLWGVG